MNNFFVFVKTIFAKKYALYGFLVVLAVLAVYFFRGNNDSKADTIVIRTGDFVHEVSVSGKIMPVDDAELSFGQVGRIDNIFVNVGDKVSKGQILASQDVGELYTKFKEAQANVDIQKAKNFISTNDVLNAETTLVNAISDAYIKTDDAVRNHADKLFYNADKSPSFGMTFHRGNTYYYVGTQDSGLSLDIGERRKKINIILGEWPFINKVQTKQSIEEKASLVVTNLIEVQNMLNMIGVVVNSQNPTDADSNSIFNDIKSGLFTARNNISLALNAVDKAKADYISTKNVANIDNGHIQTEDSLSQAQLRLAESNLQNILVQISNKSIRSPINGIVTAVNTKIGNSVSANELVILVINDDVYQVHSYVPEKNIPFVSIGNQAIVTLDAYGEDVRFDATVSSIDPAETIRDGVPTYRIKLDIVKKDDRIKSGMTANVIITTQKKSGIVSVPQAIVENRDGIKFVKVKSGDIIVDRMVETGAVSSLGQVEIISGLKDGDIVILEQVSK